MKKIKLNADTLIVPAECDIHNEAVLNLYYFLFIHQNSGWGNVPPIITCKANYEGIAPGQRYLKERETEQIRYWSRKTECDLGKVVKAGFDIEDILENLLKTDIRFQTGETYIQCEKAIATLRSTKRECEQFRQITSSAGYYLIDGNHRAIAATLAQTPISALELETDSDIQEVEEMAKKGHLIEFQRKDKTLNELIFSFEYFCLNVGGLENTTTVEERVKILIESQKLPEYVARSLANRK